MTSENDIENGETKIDLFIYKCLDDLFFSMFYPDDAKETYNSIEEARNALFQIVNDMPNRCCAFICHEMEIIEAFFWDDKNKKWMKRI